MLLGMRKSTRVFDVLKMKKSRTQELTMGLSQERERLSVSWALPTKPCTAHALSSCLHSRSGTNPMSENC